MTTCSVFGAGYWRWEAEGLALAHRDSQPREEAWQVTNSILCSGRGSTGHPILGMGVGGAKEDNVGGKVEWPERGQVWNGRAGERTCRGRRGPACAGALVCVCPEREGRKYICLIGTQDNSKKSSVCWAHLLCHVILAFLRLSQEFSQYGCEVGVIPTSQRWKLRLREAR